MSSLINTFLKEVFKGDQIKDWDHASRLFVANRYELAPKGTWSYHVFFDLANTGGRGQPVNSTKQMELGMLVKQVSLPKFDIQTKTLNAYNRSNIHQTHINYSPVTITFHDDAANVVRHFWYDYYNYYYRDSENSEQLIGGSHSELGGNRNTNNWGYSVRGNNLANPKVTPYIKSIRIYSLFNKQFSEYVLMNPIIKSFAHGDHNSSSGAETMSHTMTVEYETVLYSSGWVGQGSVKGFGSLHYDKRPSPLTPAGGGTSSIFGPGGILNSGGEIFSDLSKGNFGAALFKAGRVGSNLKGANLSTMAKTEALKMAKDVISGAVNPGSKVSVPTVGALNSTAPTVNGFGGGSIADYGAMMLAFLKPQATTPTGTDTIGAKTDAAGSGLLDNAKSLLSGMPPSLPSGFSVGDLGSGLSGIASSSGDMLKSLGVSGVPNTTVSGEQLAEMNGKLSEADTAISGSGVREPTDTTSNSVPSVSSDSTDTVSNSTGTNTSNTPQPSAKASRFEKIDIPTPTLDPNNPANKYYIESGQAKASPPKVAE